MEKKKWTSPRVDFVEFTAEEYISACRNDQNQRLYNFFCDTTYGGTPGHLGAIFYDNNGNGIFDFIGRTDDAGNSTHPDTNSYTAWDTTSWDNYNDAFAEAWRTDNGADQFVHDFNSCNSTTQTTSTAIFKSGFYVPYVNGSLLFQESDGTSTVQKVTIWHGNDGNNLHVTNQLQIEILNSAAFS